MNSQLELLKSRIPFDKDIFNDVAYYQNALKELLDDSKYFMLSYLYPFEDFSEIELPKKYYNLQIRCCMELYKMADKAGMVNYSENGIAWSKLTDGISSQIITQMTSKVGIPKKEEIGE